MSSGSASPPPSGHRSPTTTGFLTRHNTTSSVGSEPYTALPPGKYLLDLHGSCPRCHHQHNGVQVRVNTKNMTDDTTQVSHVHCEGCSANWLAFGGRNTTRISLLSALSSRPDPVKEEVRNTVIAMIKSATTMSAVGSPRLAEISESPVDNTARPNSTILPAGATQDPIGRTEERTRSVSFHLPVGRNVVGAHQPPSPTRKMPSQLEHGSLFPRPTFSHLMTRIKVRLPILARITSKKLLQKKAHGAGHNNTITAYAEPSLPVDVAATVVHVDDASERTPEATDFIETIRNHDIRQMNEAERIRWGRKTLSSFNERHGAAAPQTRTDIGTQVDTEELGPSGSTRARHHQQTLDLLELGSNHSDTSLRNRPLSVSTDRTSAAVTVVPDNDAPFSLLNYWHWQRVRPGSTTSLRSSSILGFLQRQRVDGHVSTDSSTGAVRNSSTSSGPSTNGRSSRSTLHGSSLARPGPTVTENSDVDDVPTPQVPNGSLNMSASRPAPE